MRAGLPKLEISSGDAVKKAVLGAKSVAYSSGPSGFYIAELFKKMGIAEQIKDKVKQTPSGVQVGEVVARGDADLGFQQISELLHVKVDRNPLGSAVAGRRKGAGRIPQWPRCGRKY